MKGLPQEELRTQGGTNDRLARKHAYHWSLGFSPANAYRSVGVRTAPRADFLREGYTPEQPPALSALRYTQIKQL
jgi:hypothetical protein